MAEALLAVLEELAELHSERLLTDQQFEDAKEEAIFRHRESQERCEAAAEAPREYAEGQEVVAVGLRTDTELNGARAWVVGHQRAPDGTLLTLARFESGLVRLLSSANLALPPEPPLPDLSGAWGVWYGDIWVFRQSGDRLAAIDCSSGELHTGTIRRGPPVASERRARTPRARRPLHAEPWLGVLDSPPRCRDDDARTGGRPGRRSPRSRLRSPRQKPQIATPAATTAAKGRPAWRKLLSAPPNPARCTVSLLGCVGGYDGEAIRWRSGAVWKRRHGDARARQWEDDPRLALASGSPATPPRAFGL